MSKELAEGCVEIARVQTYSDSSYTVLNTSPVTASIGTKMCTIRSVMHSGANCTIETIGKSGDAVTNLQVVIDTTTGNFLSWNEVPFF